MSGFKRFFVLEVSQNTVVEGEEFLHAVNVLRIRKGEKIYLCDQTGEEYLAEITEIAKKYFCATLISKSVNQCQAKSQVTLVCGYLKGDKTEMVVQKATELGVERIIVFSSEFCSAYMNENKLQRLRRVAVEACKQCGRSKVPEVIYCDTFIKALEEGKKAENKLFACEFATKNEVDYGSLQGSTSIVVGSEGGFSNEEYQKALDNGYKTVYLGKRILRAETASIALTAIVMNALGELG